MKQTDSVQRFVELFASKLLRRQPTIDVDHNPSNEDGFIVNQCVYVYAAEHIIPKHEQISAEITKRIEFTVCTIVHFSGNREEPPSEDYINEETFSHAVHAAEEIVRRLVQIDMANIAEGAGEYSMYYEGLSRKERLEHKLPVDPYYRVHQLTQLVLLEPNGMERVVAEHEAVSFPKPSGRVAKQIFKRHAHKII